MYEKIATNIKEASRITVSLVVLLPHSPVEASLYRGWASESCVEFASTFHGPTAWHVQFGSLNTVEPCCFSPQQLYERYFTAKLADELYHVLLPMIGPHGPLAASTSSVHCVVCSPANKRRRRRYLWS